MGEIQAAQLNEQKQEETCLLTLKNTDESLIKYDVFINLCLQMFINNLTKTFIKYFFPIVYYN